MHVAKSSLGMTDEDYRALLLRVSDISSSKELDDRGFSAVMDEFRRLGFRHQESQRMPKGAGSHAPERNRPSAAQWRLMEHRAKQVGFESISDPRFIAWAKARGNVDHPRFLDGEGARKIIAALGNWLRRMDKKHLNGGLNGK